MVSGVQIYPYMGDYLEISIDIHLISKAFGFRLDGLYHSDYSKDLEVYFDFLQICEACHIILTQMRRNGIAAREVKGASFQIFTEALGWWHPSVAPRPPRHFCPVHQYEVKFKKFHIY